MSKTIFAAAAAATIALTALCVSAGGASAAVHIKKPFHHVLVCRAGYAPHRIKIHGKWRTECLRVHHHREM